MIEDAYEYEADHDPSASDRMACSRIGRHIIMMNGDRRNSLRVSVALTGGLGKEGEKLWLLSLEAHPQSSTCNLLCHGAKLRSLDLPWLVQILAGE